jgi:hypothetical protein
MGGLEKFLGGTFKIKLLEELHPFLGQNFKKSRDGLLLQRQIIKNPTPTLTLPLKGRGFYGVFSLHGKDFMGFSHFHGSFSNPSPFKGEVRRGMGYICRCSIIMDRKGSPGSCDRIIFIFFRRC